MSTREGWVVYRTEGRGGGEKRRGMRGEVLGWRKKEGKTVTSNENKWKISGVEGKISQCYERNG